MALCRAAPTLSLIRCWLLIHRVLWYSPKTNFTRSTVDIIFLKNTFIKSNLHLSGANELKQWQWVSLMAWCLLGNLCYNDHWWSRLTHTCATRPRRCEVTAVAMVTTGIISPPGAGPGEIWHLNLVIPAPADGPAPDGAGPSAGTVLITDEHFHWLWMCFPWFNDIFQHGWWDLMNYYVTQSLGDTVPLLLWNHGDEMSWYHSCKNGVWSV